MSTMLSDRRLLEAMPACVWTAGADGAVDWINSAFARLVGIPGPAMSEDDWARLAHPQDWPRVRADWREALAGADEYAGTVRLLVAGGRGYRWYLVRARRVTGEAGGTVGWIGFNIDVDDAFREVERKHASFERLQLEGGRLRSVFADSPVAITLYEGPDHRIAMMNRANERLVGNRNFEGRTLAEAFPELVSQGIVALLDEVLDSGRTITASEHAIDIDWHGDGRASTGYFDFTLQPLSRDDGRRYGVFGSAVDVTAQVLARREVERLVAEREAVLSQLGEGLIITDAAGRITFVNECARELHGVAHLDIEPDRYAEAYALLREDGSPYPSHELPLARAVHEGRVTAPERMLVRRPDGCIVPIVACARPVVDASGQCIGAMLTVREAPPA